MLLATEAIIIMIDPECKEAVMRRDVSIHEDADIVSVMRKMNQWRQESIDEMSHEVFHNGCFDVFWRFIKSDEITEPVSQSKKIWEEAL